MKKRIKVINGPNLNMLGEREPEIYGTETLEEINGQIERLGKLLGIDCEFYQSNSEGELVSAIQGAIGYDAIILNAGAYTHYSYAIHDAIKAVGVPVTEVHMSNTQAREGFRGRSVIGAACRGVIAGFGSMSYLLALQGVAMSENNDK